MPIETARKILNQLRDGSEQYSEYIIRQALKATGDLAEIYE